MKIRFNALRSKRLSWWEFYETSYVGGQDYIDSRKLFQHRYEADKDYRERVKRSYYLNFVRPIVDTYTKFIMGLPLTRVAVKGREDNFESFRKSADGRGMSLSAFMRRACSLSSVYGRYGILPCGPGVDGMPEIRTALSDEENPPRLRGLPPKNVLDWSKDSKGDYNWLFFYYDVDYDDNPNIPRRTMRRYELWDRNTWKIFEGEKNKMLVNQGLKQINSGKHELGFVPYVELIHTDSDVNDEPESLVSDISMLAQTVYNYSSLLDEMLHLQAFSQLTMPGDKETVNTQIMGVSRVWTYDPDSPYPPAYISPDASQARLIMDMIRISISEMYRLAMLQYKEAEKGQLYATAFGKVIDFEETENALITKSTNMQEAEDKVSRYVNAWFGGDADELLWRSTYPMKFEARSYTQEVADALAVVELQMGDRFMSELKKRIAKRGLPNIDPKTMSEIEKEIDSLKEEIVPSNINAASELNLLQPPEKISATRNNPPHSKSVFPKNLAGSKIDNRRKRG